jgi:hypothetical protein
MGAVQSVAKFSECCFRRADISMFISPNGSRMQRPIVQTEFDAVTRDGQEFVVKVAIGDPHDFPTSSGAIDVGF